MVRRTDTRRRAHPVGLAAAAAMAYGVATPALAAAGTLGCDESLKAGFKPDAQTTVLSVTKVRKGDPYPNKTVEQFVHPDLPMRFAADLCWVKLLVGPGVPGPAGAPSTSRGIGIEVWLPEKDAWNHRVHAIGNSGWGNGTEEATLGRISSWTLSGGESYAAPRVAAEEGAVTSTTDNGQQDRGGAFALLPDGSANVAGWRDWSYRGLYEQAVKTKALAEAYYGSAPRYAYFDGASGGGRQAHHIAQNLPEQYDGILSRVPGVDWTSFVAEVYPAIVAMRDLDGQSPTPEQLESVSRAAVAACDLVGGEHLGFILDIKSCRYDPTKDPSVICRSDGGQNDTPACVTQRQALAVNKVWYGMTVDGSVPDPAVDNGWDAPATGVRRWYGYPRGGALRSLTDAGAWAGGPGVGRDVVALALRNPRLAPPGFKNATGNGEDGWKGLTYPQLAAAFEALSATQGDYGINSNNPDLTRLRNAGTKFMHVAHMHDASVWLPGHTAYYDQVVTRMGGLAAVQAYYKFYVLPGLGHGNMNGTGNRLANPPVVVTGQLYKALTDWVERGVSPDGMVFASPEPGRAASPSAIYPTPAGPRISLPACAYPAIATYVSGDIHKAESYACR